MYIKKIKLSNFRNYETTEIDICNEINVFFGDNAQGKTNILESIFMIAIGKSFRAKKEKELIKLGQKEAIIEVYFEKKDREGNIKIIINDKKEVIINGIKQKKMSDLLGKINVVMFSPDDIEIIKSSPVKRRRFLNVMISQLRPNYVHTLNLYNKTLEQRNNYLKQIKIENKNKELLEIWDEKLNEYAQIIYKYRKEFIDKLKEKMIKIHKDITDNKEDIKINYITDIKSNYLEELKNNRDNDIQKGYTVKGIHRDDFEIKINDKNVNIYGSQGQNRTAVLTIKLAELQVIKDEIGEYPVLLLDDFMSELDEKRQYNFLKNISYTQVLITCTKEFTIDNKMCKTFYINNGIVNNNI